jgi:prephenate dehydratase
VTSGSHTPIRVAYLGPSGTFNEEALLGAVGDQEVELMPLASVNAAIGAVRDGDAARALVPFENSIEGAVTGTLDALAHDDPGVVIVGEHDLPVHQHLIARRGTEPARIEVVLSHPQALAQCAGFLRERLPEAELRSASSTSEAVRTVSERTEPWGALGSRRAADLYGCEVVLESVEDEPDNVTRFVWMAPVGTEAPAGKRWRTSLVFAELGEDHPGALVEALQEFSSRRVNLTRIESRPLRQGLGRYMFFIDLDGGVDDAPVADAIRGLRAKAESVRILGSYPTEVEPGVPGSG